MDVLRVGIVGCGRIAWEFEDKSKEHPASIAGGFDALDETCVVAACNRGRERLERFGKRWGVAALYQDFREMLRSEALDIVVAATHPPLHVDIVEAACENGVKGIFCEKPMALDLADCDRIVRAVERSQTKLLVNCSRRFGGIFESVRRLTEGCELGQLVHMVGHCQGVKPYPEWVADTEGPLLHDAVHLLDLMRFYAGDVESLIGVAKNRTRRFRVEDTSHAILEFKNGVEGIVVSDEMAEYSDFSLELNYTNGRICLSNGYATGMWTTVPNPANTKSGVDSKWRQLSEHPLPEPAWKGTNMLWAVRTLVDAVLNGAPLRCDARDGRAAVELIMAIYESQAIDGGRVQLPLEGGPSSLEKLRTMGIL